MLRNYLTIAYRNLKRNKSYTLINAGGLALGLACCILIALYVRKELSYDDFHADADRIMFVGHSFSGPRSNMGPYANRPNMGTPYPLADALERELPDVEQAVRILWTGFRWPGTSEVSRDGQQFFKEEDVFLAGPAFFEIFSFPFVKGTPKDALSEPNTAVISEALAEKYFPDENPIGQALRIKNFYFGARTYRITGVAHSRDNSYLDFNAVLSLSTLRYLAGYTDYWRRFGFLTFAVLEEGATEEVFETQVARLVKEHVGENTGIHFLAVPITGLYLSDFVIAEGFQGKWRYIYLFGIVAVFILLIACVNYVNLSTARATQRAKEVGVRKTVGATHGQVARQFLGESVLMSAGAFLLALLLARAALPFFNTLIGVEMTFAEAGAKWFLLLGAAAVGVGLLAGSYPALYLASFDPVPVLRGRIAQSLSGAAFRKGLVVLQFTVAVILLTATAVVYQQLRYTQTKDLGFDGEQVLVVGVPGPSGATFRREVLAHPGVVSATVANGVPGTFRLGLSTKPDSVSSRAQTDSEKYISIKPAVVDYHFVETLGLELVAGRGFSRERPSDAERAYLLNETAARALGWTPEEAIGKPLSLAGGGEVIGVVEDFHIESLHEKIDPVVLSLHEFENVSASPMLAARLAPDAIQAGLRHIEEVWTRFSSEPFEYHFLDTVFAETYRTERRLGQVFTGFAFIAILIACLGLFGLVAFTTERRTKEIGIRKVLGASVPNIVALLSRDFLKLVLMALVLAVPVAYLAMQRWLQDFAYHIDLGPWIFVGAGALALAIALLTVSYQAVKAALANPVEALRDE